MVCLWLNKISCMGFRKGRLWVYVTILTYINMSIYLFMQIDPCINNVFALGLSRKTGCCNKHWLLIYFRSWLPRHYCCCLTYITVPRPSQLTHLIQRTASNTDGANWVSGFWSVGCGVGTWDYRNNLTFSWPSEAGSDLQYVVRKQFSPKIGVKRNIKKTNAMVAYKEWNVLKKS